MGSERYGPKIVNIQEIRRKEKVPRIEQPNHFIWKII